MGYLARQVRLKQTDQNVGKGEREKSGALGA